MASLLSSCELSICKLRSSRVNGVKCITFPIFRLKIQSSLCFTPRIVFTFAFNFSELGNLSECGSFFLNKLCSASYSFFLPEVLIKGRLPPIKNWFLGLNSFALTGEISPSSPLTFSIELLKFSS
jgi:hypothetical protein